MNYQIFKNQIVEKVRGYFCQRIKVTLQEVTKNNGIVLTGLTLSVENINISPTIYLEGFYQDYCKGRTMDEIVKEIIFIYTQSKMEENFNMEFFTNYDKAKKNIVYKLVNYEKNRSLLREIPHRRFLDLAIVFYYILEEEAFTRATILIHNSHLDMWGVNADEIFGVASVNTPGRLKFTISGMLEVLSELGEDNFDSGKTEDDRCVNTESESPEDYMINCIRKDETDMYVLSNTERMNGAVSILYSGVLDAFAKKMGHNFFILPSSVHEVILIPDENNIDKKNLEAMVRDVNMTQLDPEEYLSDTVYYYSAEQKKVVCL